MVSCWFKLLMLYLPLLDICGGDVTIVCVSFCRSSRSRGQVCCKHSGCSIWRFVKLFWCFHITGTIWIPNKSGIWMFQMWQVVKWSGFRLVVWKPVKKCLFFYSKANGNHEITIQKRKRNFFLPHRDLNHAPLELKASVLPMSYADPTRKQDGIHLSGIQMVQLSGI